MAEDSLYSCEAFLRARPLAPALLFEFYASSQSKATWLIAYSSPSLTGATKCPLAAFPLDCHQKKPPAAN